MLLSFGSRRAVGCTTARWTPVSRPRGRPGTGSRRWHRTGCRRVRARCPGSSTVLVASSAETIRLVVTQAGLSADLAASMSDDGRGDVGHPDRSSQVDRQLPEPWRSLPCDVSVSVTARTREWPSGRSRPCRADRTPPATGPVPCDAGLIHAGRASVTCPVRPRCRGRRRRAASRCPAPRRSDPRVGAPL